MKINERDFNELKSCIILKMSELEAILRDHKKPSPEKPFGNLIDHYEKGRFPRADKVKDLQVRFCFDMYSSSVNNGFKKHLYTYLNDDHILTALKKICPVVIRKY